MICLVYISFVRDNATEVLIEGYPTLTSIIVNKIDFTLILSEKYQDMASIYTKLPSDIEGVIRSYVRPIHPVVSMVGMAYNKHIKKRLHKDIVVVNKLSGVRRIEIHWEYRVENRRDGRPTIYYRRFMGYIHDIHTYDEIIERIVGYINEADMGGYSYYAEIHDISTEPVYHEIADMIDFVNGAGYEEYYNERNNDEITFEAVHSQSAQDRY